MPARAEMGGLMEVGGVMEPAQVADGVETAAELTGTVDAAMERASTAVTAAMSASMTAAVATARRRDGRGESCATTARVAWIAQTAPTNSVGRSRHHIQLRGIDRASHRLLCRLHDRRRSRGLCHWPRHGTLIWRSREPHRLSSAVLFILMDCLVTGGVVDEAEASSTGECPLIVTGARKRPLLKLGSSPGVQSRAKTLRHRLGDSQP